MHVIILNAWNQIKLKISASIIKITQKIKIAMAKRKWVHFGAQIQVQKALPATTIAQMAFSRFAMKTWDLNAGNSKFWSDSIFFIAIPANGG